MALEPPDGYPIASYADLRRAMERAPYDVKAAVAVRNFLMEAAYYRSLVASGQMSQNQYLIALEELRQLQRDAAVRGFLFNLETTGATGNKVVFYPPPVVGEIEARREAAEVAKPYQPEGVHFTSHQRVGDEIRDSYIGHIHEMFAGGFIDQDEHDARLAAIMIAHTKEEMEFLIQDLPGIPGKKPAVVTAEVGKKGGGRITINPPGFMLGFMSVFAVIAALSTTSPVVGNVTVIVMLLAISVTITVSMIMSIIKRRK